MLKTLVNVVVTYKSLECLHSKHSQVQYLLLNMRLKNLIGIKTSQKGLNKVKVWK